MFRVREMKQTLSIIVVLFSLLFPSLSWAEEHPLIGKSLFCERVFRDQPSIYLFEETNPSLVSIHLHSDFETKEIIDWTKTFKVKLGEIEEDALYWYVNDGGIFGTLKIRLDRVDLSVSHYHFGKNKQPNFKPKQSQYKSGGGIYHNDCKIIGDIEDGKKEIKNIKEEVTEKLYKRWGRPLSKEEKEKQLEEIKKNRKI